ncbi:MAG: hypothetical protein QG641_1219 [Candidatus Poribacteria bacterium]|nr:hypothetical protein [Candidatus Poribacteria bacterium]
MGIKANITIDTHCLVWYVHEELNKKLSGKVMQIIAEAENSSSIYIPTIVLMEIYDLEEYGENCYLTITLLDFCQSHQKWQ